MSLRTRRSLALLTAIMTIAAACTGAPSATPTGAPTTAAPGTEAPGTEAPGTEAPGTEAPGTEAPGTEAPGTEAPTEEPTATESPAAEAGTLVYVIDGEITFLTNGNNDVPTAEAVQWLYDALFAYDNTITPVPNLAAGDVEFSEDGLTATVRLIDNAIFQGPPGTPGVGDAMTADDVVFTYEMALSPNCRFNPSICLGELVIPDPETGEDVAVFESVEAVDDLTVQFNLNTPYAPFRSTLAGIAIESRAATEASFAEFQEAAQAVTVEDVQALVDRITEEQENPTGSPDPAASPPAPTVNLAQFRGEIESVLQSAQVELPREEAYQTETGLDETAYVEAEIALLESLLDSLTAEAGDAIAAAYPLLSVQRAPVGTGPFYLTEFLPGQSLTYVRNEQYHKGVPALAGMNLPIIKDQVARASALVAGDIDWTHDLDADAFAVVQDNPNVKVAEYADFTIFGVQFNLREGQIWAEKEMRQATAHCIDKEAMVDAANQGEAVAIHADLPPASWGYNPDIPIYEHNVELANQMITDLGYTRGADGVYEREGQRLETTILVRAGQPARIAFMQLFADALNTDCGFNITVQEADFSTVLLPMLEWPHTNPPEAPRQFDAYFGGWGNYGIDPDPYSIWHSSQCTTEEQPDLFNYICFQNERADEIIEQQIVELDFEARRTLIQEFELIMAEELPYLWAWAPVGREGLRTNINQTDAEWTTEFMNNPFWFWEVEKITKTSE
jgi:ABC-type transport system substrate-binding protein